MRRNPKGKTDCTALAIKLKRQLNDIIDVAYGEIRPDDIPKFKRFRIYCTDAEMRSRLGDCYNNKANMSSEIRIFATGTEGYKEIIITCIHELSHHIDFIIRGDSNHDHNFYEIHKKLLYAAFDMGILTVNDVRFSESRARNRDKLARMMSDYVPHPVAYKQDKAQIYAYNCFAIKDTLKSRGYAWNGLDKAWTIEIPSDTTEEEKAFLAALGVSEEDIKVISGGAVAVRLRKNVKLYNVPFEKNAVVKSLGYSWDKKEKVWAKKIPGNDISDDERNQLRENIPMIGILVT